MNIKQDKKLKIKKHIFHKLRDIKKINKTHKKHVSQCKSWRIIRCNANLVTFFVSSSVLLNYFLFFNC